jgi:hypothetical protein
MSRHFFRPKKFWRQFSSPELHIAAVWTDWAKFRHLGDIFWHWTNFFSKKNRPTSWAKVSFLTNYFNKIC